MRFDCLRDFILDRGGAVAPVYAIAIPTLVAIAGVGFDYSRMASLDTELQNAADQAALAGASQLDGKALSGTTPGACARAAGAVISFVANNTRFANDGEDALVTFQNEADCDAIGSIRFWQDKNKTTAATSDANAKFIEVVTDVRTARYALTPIVGATNPTMQAAAMAGLGSSVCRVPPIMLCSPDPSKKFDADDYVGIGIVATGHAPGNSPNNSTGGGHTGDQTDTGQSSTWAPGDFGFLQVSDPTETTKNRNERLLRALAYANPPVDCVAIGDNKVSTGNPQGLYEAVNTRFDIYDFNSNGNGVLSSCKGANCPSAPNVVKDLSIQNPNGNNSCKIGSNGATNWVLPDLGKEFRPVTGLSPLINLNSSRTSLMGLPRDNCHYTSYNSTGKCPAVSNGRFGDGSWARADYFNVNHKSGATVTYPPNWATITRYQTYLWELAQNNMPVQNGAGQRGKPVCFSGSPAGAASRRVLTVAIVSNCSSLNGTAQPVEIDDWADVFLVEPSLDDSRRWNAFKDAIYVEVIGKSRIGGNGTYSSQQVRRDVPYLVR